jgi:predicted MPP superfamily phosphohydrolase
VGSFAALFFALVPSRLLEGQAEQNLAVHAIAWYGSFFMTASAILMYRQKKNNGHSRRCLPSLLLIIACVYFGVAVDTLLIEPTALVIRELTIATPKISEPMTIVFCADMQTDQVGDYERRTLLKIKEQNADLILFGGDYIQGKNDEANRKILDDWNKLFQEVDLQVPLGIYAIQGNKEIGHPWRDMFAGTAIIPRGTTGTLQIGEIRTTFLSVRSSWAKRKIEEKAVDGKFRIMLGHMPVFSMADQEADLLLAGHSHGGQVQIPFFGPIHTNSGDLPRKWASGVTTLPNGATLIVTNGSGLARDNVPRVRFFCRPDFWVIRLVPQLLRCP